MNRFMKVIATALSILCMLCLALPIHAFALAGKGTLVVVAKYDDHALSGINVEAYQVAYVADKEGGAVYTLTSDFVGSGILGAELKGLSAEENAKMANRFHRYASDNHIRRESQTTNRRGEARFDSLDAGFYLVVQNNPAAPIGPRGEKYTMQPFLLLIPHPNEGGLGVTVTAFPKCEVESSPPPPYSPPSVPPPYSPPPNSTPPPTPSPTTPPPTSPDTPPSTPPASPDTPPSTSPTPPYETPPSASATPPNETPPSETTVVS